jgi:glycosyltransferase involved in cell wall biosynthesis
MCTVSTVLDKTLAPGSGILLVNSAHNMFGRASGYRIREYLPEVDSVQAVRTDPHGLIERLVTRVVRAGAFTSWYRLSSAQSELAALRRLILSRYGTLHVLWADSDLGYLDLLPLPQPLARCGTFHQCSDTLAQALRNPQRIRRLHALILMSHSQTHFFRSQGIEARKIHVIHHGVDTTFFCPGDLDPGLFRVLVVGSYRRNFRMIRELCQTLPLSPDFVVTVVAPGVYHHHFSGLQHVEVHARLTDEDLRTLYRSSSCLLMTAENATANNAVLEAMACGLPVVGERIGGIPEYVTTGCGLLESPGSVDRLAHAVRMLRESRLMRQEMKEQSRTRALQLDWIRVAERMRLVYSAAQTEALKTRA